MKKPINHRRIERVANLIQEYNIAEMKHITGKSNCLPNFLTLPFVDPLFDIPYGVESKQPLPSIISNISKPLSSTKCISPMVLRPHHRAPPPPPSVEHPRTDTDVRKVEFKSAALHTADSPSSSQILTSPSPNNFNCHDLIQEQNNDPDIQRIITHLSNPDKKSNSYSSFIIKNQLLHKLVTLSSNSHLKTAVPYLPTSMIKSLLTAMHDDPY